MQKSVIISQTIMYHLGSTSRNIVLDHRTLSCPLVQKQLITIFTLASHIKITEKQSKIQGYLL